MGTVGARVVELIQGLRETPWPDGERLGAWADGAGDDPAAAWASCARADDLLALAAAWGVASRPALAEIATLLREAASAAALREARVARVAFAAEQGAPRSPSARARVLDDAKSLLVEAERQAALIAKQTKAARVLSYRAAMEVMRGAGFLALAIVSEGADAIVYANLAHALRQLAGAFAATRVAPDEASAAPEDETPKALETRLAAAIDAAVSDELAPLAARLRAALAADFARAVGAGSA